MEEGVLFTKKKERGRGKNNPRYRVHDACTSGGDEKAVKRFLSRERKEETECFLPGTEEGGVFISRLATRGRGRLQLPGGGMTCF